MSEILHDREIAATEEMIKNLRAGTFRKYLTGIGACGALLLAGIALVIWTSKQGNDPEVLKEALRHMPPLAVTVKLDPDSKVTLADGGKVTLANPPVMPAMAGRSGGSHDPAIQTNVTVFKTIAHGTDEIVSGWKFANGAATTPINQYCYLKKSTPAGRIIQDIADDGVLGPTPPGVLDQQARFAKCQWFNGDLG